MARKRQRQLSRIGWMFTAPAVAFFAVFFIYPIGMAIWISFTRWDLFTAPVFVGLDNYREIFTDPLFANSLRVTLIFGVATTVTVCIASLCMALLTERPVRGLAVYSTAYFIPSVLPLAAVAVLWGYMLANTGFVDDALRSSTGITVPFLTSSHFAIYALVFTQAWASAGYFMLLFKAGLRAIPSSVYDAAKVDGASWARVLWHVTVPLLKPTFFFVITILMINTFQQFDLFYLMTSGGPGYSTQALTYRIYLDAVSNLRLGTASAESVVLVVIMIVLAMVQARIFRTDITYE